MLNQVRRFKLIAVLMACTLWILPQSASAQSFKKTETSLYRDIFDQNLYYEGTSYLRLDRLYRKLFGQKARALNVNAYDEVPDSPYFTNRHSRKRLSSTELEKGSQTTSGPDLSGDLTVIRGKTEGLHPGFFIQDRKGDKYLLKFDPADNLELVTSAEVIASRMYHAIGYNVPQYTVTTFSPDKLTPAADATMVDSSGFTRALTKDRLDEFLLFIPWDESGRFRASASKIVEGDFAGNFFFEGRRRDNPKDKISHEKLREIRGLQIFSSWINNYDVRASNTLDMAQAGNLKHYLIDFNSALGAAAEGPKPPMFTHEHFFDYGETLKAVLSFGLWEKPWQKRWRESGQEIFSPAVGYFDNRHFNPGDYKIQFPHYAFKDVTLADAFWATKIIMTFTDEDIRAMVKAGQYSNSKDADYIAKTLIERRDIIGKYWFSRSNSLDLFDVKGSKLVFEDLSVKYEFIPSGSSVYHVDVIGKNGKKSKKITSFETKETSFEIASDWKKGYSEWAFLIRTTRPGSSERSPYVLVEVNSQGVKGILHQD